MNVTIFENLLSKQPIYLTPAQALTRIRSGRSAEKVGEIRKTIDKSKANSLKRALPAVVWSGKLTARGDSNLSEHSGLLVLDFDKVEDIGEKMASLQTYPHTFACWLSPSGNGIKALIRIADGTKHREHFAALRETFADADASGANEERLCFESYDPHLYHNPAASPFTGILTVTKHVEKFAVDDNATFQKLLTWAAGKAGAFTDGNRNTFVFKLAGALCRFGIDIQTAAALISNHFPTSNDFTFAELNGAVKSGYKKNQSIAGSAIFEQERLIDRKSRKEVKLDDIAADLDPTTRPRDVIYAADVKEAAMRLYTHGHENLKGIGIDEIDMHWKPKPGELTCLTGIGNYGKSAFYKWYQLMRVLLYGERFATFSPEDNPPEEYYLDFVEMLLSCDCTPKNPNRPPIEIYEQAYEWIGQHIFYLYPQDTAPTPAYIKERFLELIVKEKVNGVGVDPFNQMVHEEGEGRTDQYLSTILADFSRFAQANAVPFMIIAHPKQMQKDGTKNYPCPDVFDLNGGAMWNNKMDNILAYHRPFRQTSPDDPAAEFHAKKVRRQKIVGRPGMSDMRYIGYRRRFEFGDKDPMEEALKTRGISFYTGSAPIIPPAPIVHPDFTLPDDFWND